MSSLMWQVREGVLKKNNWFSIKEGLAKISPDGSSGKGTHPGSGV